MNKKVISICVPCRNEVENVKPLAEELGKYMEQFPQYNFEIIFIDNCSTDGTQNKLREICSNDKRIKAILNARNYKSGSAVHVFFQAQGDCIIQIPADFQVPLDLIPKVISEWEKGTQVVALIKENSQKDKIRFIRKFYYILSKKFSNNNTLSGFTGVGLYDKSFVNMCKNLKDPLFSTQYMLLNYSSSFEIITYNEQPRLSGKSNHSFSSLTHIAINRFIRASDTVPHYAILMGLGIGIVSFIISIYYLIRKLLDWQNFPLGMAPLIIGVFFLGAVQLVFIGLIGEYVLMINERQKNKPLVVEKERINFEEEEAPDNTITKKNNE